MESMEEDMLGFGRGFIDETIVDTNLEDNITDEIKRQSSQILVAGHAQISNQALNPSIRN
jgi:hypothetical protein